MKKRTYANGKVEEHPMIFPTHLRTGSMWLRTPIDDTHTLQWTVGFTASEDGTTSDPATDEPEVTYLAPVKDPPDALHPQAKFNFYANWGQILVQDMVMWETQGPRSDREHERLATSDEGITMLRELMFQEIEKVRRGDDPMGVMRDPNHPIVDTNFENEKGRLSGVATQVVDWRAPGMENVSEEQLSKQGYGGPA
jgi:5,5'-dehydrodivanillate O-demethylase